MTTPARALVRAVFSRPGAEESLSVREWLGRETVGGGLLLGAAAVAFVLANTPWGDAYTALRELRLGPAALHLDLPLATWAADGLLAIFFFVAGLELKRELVVGDLRDPAKAAVPVAAALCGVALPAVVFLGAAHLAGGDPAVLHGWAVPTATDIAFALSVLAVVGTQLPSALRSFLLTLAVVDDLVAIIIIAAVYTDHLDVLSLALAVLPLLAFAVLVRRGMTTRWLLLPLAALTWYLVHASGIHATVAGVLLGLAIPVSGRHKAVAHVMERRVHPVSAGFAVPVFAFFAAGVDLRGGGVGAAASDPAAIAVVVALVLGKFVGVLGGTWLTTRFTRAELDPEISWADVAGLALLTGVGFTVSLLVSELAYGAGSPHDDHVKVAVLAGSVIAAVLASIVLRRRNAVYAAMDADDGTQDAQSFTSGQGVEGMEGTTAARGTQHSGRTERTQA